MKWLQKWVQVDGEDVGWAKRTQCIEIDFNHEIRLCYTWRGIPYTIPNLPKRFGPLWRSCTMHEVTKQKISQNPVAGTDLLSSSSYWIANSFTDQMGNDDVLSSTQRRLDRQERAGGFLEVVRLTASGSKRGLS
jgi:hypothetical protein